MQEKNTTPENSTMEALVPGLRNYWKISSPDPVSGDMVVKNHEVKHTELVPKIQHKINLSKPFCAGCGRAVEFGMFCSDSCEREIFGP